MFTTEVDNFDWLLTVLQSNNINFKISQFSRFLQSSGCAILIQISKWPKLLYFVPFIKKTCVNYVSNRIWSFWLTLVVLQSKKINFKISQFSRSMLRSRYPILVKILKWLKLFHSLPIHHENTCKSCLQSNLIILTDFHSFAVKEDELQN